MSLYAYYWPNDTVSLVNVERKDDVAYFLDEVGDFFPDKFDPKRLIPVSQGMIITLKKTKGGDFMLDFVTPFNEEFDEHIKYEKVQKYIADSKKVDEELHKIAKD